MSFLLKINYHADISAAYDLTLNMDEFFVRLRKHNVSYSPYMSLCTGFLFHPIKAPPTKDWQHPRFTVEVTLKHETGVINAITRLIRAEICKP